MRPVLEVVLSLLAVAGMMSLSWLLFGRILTPAGNRETVSMVPGQGDGEGLEQAVRGLLWLRGGGMLQGELVIVDCGLSPTGRSIAAALCMREPGVEVWALSDLPRQIQGKLKMKSEK